MGKVVLTRIDDRLIHGQVMTTWLHYTNANRIIIIDNGVFNNKFMRNVLEMVIPQGIQLDICNVDNGTNILKNDLKEKDRVIVLTKYPDTINELLDRGVEIKSVNVGGMGAKPGRKKLYKTISISSEEKQMFKGIISKGVKVFVQIIPDDKVLWIDKLL